MQIGEQVLERLQKGADVFACGSYLAQLDTLHQTDIYTTLEIERLARKNRDIEKIYAESYENWNQTFYILLMRFLGAPNNREAFAKLASIVNYGLILRYQHSLQTLEAMLIGASGLLDCYPDDNYTNTLKQEFAYYAHKYNLEKMQPSEWTTTRIYPHNQPVLRMAQAAAFLSQHDFAFETILKCRTPKDVAALFSVGASDYWTNHFTPAHDTTGHIKRIGFSKSNVIGINVVVPIQFAYSRYIGSEELYERAMNLLEDSPAESNSKVNHWAIYGIRPQNAFETQALIQLGDCYCKQKRCAECPIGRRIIKSVENCCKTE